MLWYLGEILTYEESVRPFGMLYMKKKAQPKPRPQSKVGL
jgi:hypothetical protein